METGSKAKLEGNLTRLVKVSQGDALKTWFEVRAQIKVVTNLLDKTFRLYHGAKLLIEPQSRNLCGGKFISPRSLDDNKQIRNNGK